MREEGPHARSPSGEGGEWSTSRRPSGVGSREEALRVLELPETLDRVAARASTPMGKERIRALRPLPDRTEATRELARVEQTVAFLEARPDWAPPAIPDARRALRVLDVEGSPLDGEDLRLLAGLLEASRLLRRALAVKADEEERPLLGVLRSRLLEWPEEEERIDGVVDERGEVRDGASPTLRTLRNNLRRARSRIVRKLEAFIRDLPDSWVVPDASVSVRDGRYVVPVRREAKGEVGGVIHGESGSGATLFVEPPVAIQLMNELRDLEEDEAREVRRILMDATDRLRSRRDDVQGSFDALLDFDGLWARARTARAWKGRAPELLPPDARGLVLADARHPLLLEQMAEGEVVPYHLELLEDEYVMVVSGPNTGGKTVFLKGVGLLAVLAQCGVVPPVGAGTRLPFFRTVFTDIGDQQSISESLSTFSAHLRNQRAIVEEAGPEDLVLMDEMGTGTDPAEGAALARAVLVELAERRARAFVTSHLGALKRLDGEGTGIVNGSLQFDPDRIAPTYVLRKGRPGRSYGLAIARRLGFPARILDRAEGFLGEDEVSVEELLETLERKEKEARELLSGLSRKEEEVERLRGELASREDELSERERTAERRAREEARRLLMEAREEVEEAIQEVRQGGEGALDERARRARRKVEEAARTQEERKPGPSPGRRAPSPGLSTGDRVKVLGSGARGVVSEVRDDRVVVEASGLRLQVSASEVEVLDGAEGPDEPRGKRKGAGTGGWTGPSADAATEVDLRGLRVQEVDGAVHRALDGAVLADLPELRVIHGKGTGALRARVRELLAEDSRVAEFRPGGPGEGGEGVTVVSFR